MMRSVSVGLAFIAPIFFPWPFVIILALIAASYSPFVPLAVGIFTDALYYTHGASSLIPWATILGAIAAFGALFVRRFVETSIMR